MNDLTVEIDKFQAAAAESASASNVELKKGDVDGETAFRLVVKRINEPVRGVWTRQRTGENDAGTIHRLVTYHAANDLPVKMENEPLQEI